jgi:hypothetical protein
MKIQRKIMQLSAGAEKAIADFEYNLRSLARKCGKKMR